MLQLHPANQRGHTSINWLESWHSFSFGEYYDAYNMGFSDLRVLNDDTISPDSGFSLHHHDNMEIITVVLSGALQHKDNLGNSSVIREGEIQQMTAGSGITHSEFNHSQKTDVHFLQIWILPDQVDLEPSYQQKSFNLEKTLNKFCLIASKDGRENSLKINQQADIYQTILQQDKILNYEIKSTHQYWIQIASGNITINDQPLVAGDGLAISEEQGSLLFKGVDPKSQFLVFKLRQ